MTTVEQVNAFLTILQTTLLAMYGWETFRLRSDAAEQNKLIAKQIENATHQNGLTAKQLQVMADGLEFQRQTIEQEAQPALHLSVIDKDHHCCKILVQNIKKNVLFTELRSNDSHATCCLFRKHWRHILVPRKPDRCIYLAAVYRTYRGQIKAQVFTYHTGDNANVIKAEPDYNYTLLSIVGRSDMPRTAWQK